MQLLQQMHTFKIWGICSIRGLPRALKSKSSASSKKLLNGAVLLHCQVTQLRGDGGVEIATDVLAPLVPTAWGGWRLVLAPVWSEALSQTC